MIDIETWMKAFLEAVETTFGSRVWFVGLQGSYGRGEATKTSDVDPVVILDRVTCEDLRVYSRMLDTLSHRELICGFLSGKDEILHWEASDLFQFYYDTLPVKGSLDELLSRIDGGAVKRAIRMGAGNIYHGCVHNMLHEKSDEILKGLYKSASFVVQAKVYAQRGTYVRRLEDLRLAADPDEQKIVDTFFALKKGAKVDFQKASEALFAWSGKQIVADR